MTIRNAQDFWAGIFFLLCGAAAVVFAQENELGTAARMGPGYFPTVLGIGLIMLGSVCALKGLFKPCEGSDGGKIAPCNFRILGLVLGAIAIFCLILEPLGLIASLAVMIAVCSVASDDSHWKETLVLILVLNAVCWVIFVYLIGMTIPVFPAFLN